MKLRMNQCAVRSIFIALVSFITMVNAVYADKVKIAGSTIKGGTIKPSSGNEAGTTKDVIHMRINQSGGIVPPDLTLYVEMSLVAGKVRGAPIKVRLRAPLGENPQFPVEWELHTTGGEYHLTRNGQTVDKTAIPKMLQEAEAYITIESSVFDDARFPYKGWEVSAYFSPNGSEATRGEPVIKIPIVVTAPGPAVPIPYPVPK